MNPINPPADLRNKFKFTKLADVQHVAGGAEWRYGFTLATSSTWDELLDVVQSSHHHFIFEQMRPNMPCKMYFDVEMEVESQPSAEAEKEWFEVLMSHIQQGINAGHVFVSNGSRLYNQCWKRSYHLTFVDSVVGSNLKIKPIAMKINSLLPSTHKTKKHGKDVCCIDESVYKDNQCMRTVNSRKPPKSGEVLDPSWLKPWDTRNWCELSFQHPLEEREWFSQSFITNVPLMPLLEVVGVEEMKDAPEPPPTPLTRVPRVRQPPPPAQPETVLQRARMLAARVSPTCFEDWSMLGFALFTVFGGSDEGLYFFLSLWSGRPMFDEAKARRAYCISEGRLGLGYLERMACRVVPGAFDQDFLLSQTGPIKTEIKKCDKEDIDKLELLNKRLEEISVAYINQFFLAIVDEKPVVCKESLTGTLTQFKLCDTLSSGWPAIKREMKLWNESVARRTFRGLKFDPNVDGHITDEDGEVHYNLWKGAAYPFDSEYNMEGVESNIQPYLDHMRVTLCDGNEDQYQYLLKWLAHTVQHPGKPTRVGIVLQGDQGTGKGLFVQKYKDIHGKRYFYQVMDQDNGLLGKFAPEGMETCTNCFVDEAFFPGNMSDVQKIKKLITESERDIEKKYGARRTFKNFTNYVFASNSDYVVKCDPQERRYMVLKVNNRYAGVSNAVKDEYFSKVNATPVADLAQYLYRVDLTGFKPTDFPRTEGIKCQKQHSLPPVGLWWEEALRNGYVKDNGLTVLSFTDKLDGLDTISQVQPKDLFIAYQHWHQNSRNPARIISSEEVFKTQLREYLTPRGEKTPIFTVIRPRNTGGGPRNRVWQFPELSVLQHQFSLRMDVPDYFKEEDDTRSPPPKRTRLISPSRAPPPPTPPTPPAPPLTRSTLYVDGQLHPRVRT